MSHLLINDYNTILYDDNSSFTEYTLNMKSWDSLTMGAVLTATEDHIYIGCPHSFASRFIYMDGTNVNSEASALTCEYYAGTTTGWRSVKNFEDMTRSGTATLAQHGFISWDLPSDWIKTQVNDEPELPYNSPTGDGNGYYWIRLKASVTLSVGTAIRFLGLIWTNQAYMKVRWAEVDSSRYLPTGQTDWYELIEMSTSDVVTDLNIQNVIDYELQAKDIGELADLTALKTLMNILLPMTSSETLKEMRDDFKSKYEKLLRKRLKSVDVNKDEKISQNESKPLTNTRIVRY